MRRKVKVRVLDKARDNTGVQNVDGDEVEAETYVWKADINGLEEGEWDFGEFVREKMGRWVGASAEDEGLQGRKKAHYILGVFVYPAYVFFLKVSSYGFRPVPWLVSRLGPCCIGVVALGENTHEC